MLVRISLIKLYSRLLYILAAFIIVFSLLGSLAHFHRHTHTDL